MQPIQSKTILLALAIGMLSVPSQAKLASDFAPVAKKSGELIIAHSELIIAHKGGKQKHRHCHIRFRGQQNVRECHSHSHSDRHLHERG